jgi:hypothetical protein
MAAVWGKSRTGILISHEFIQFRVVSDRGFGLADNTTLRERETLDLGM